MPGLFLQHRQLDAEEAQWAKEENELEPVRQAFFDLLRQNETGILILTQQPQWGHYSPAVQILSAAGAHAGFEPGGIRRQRNHAQPV